MGASRTLGTLKRREAIVDGHARLFQDAGKCVDLIAAGREVAALGRVFDALTGITERGQAEGA